MFEHTSHPEGLRDELLDAGIPVALVMRDPEDAARTIVDVPDEYRDAAEAIVLAHDAAGYQQAEQQARQAFLQDAATLKTYRTTPKASITGAMTVDAIWALTDIMRSVVQELRED